MTLPLKAVNQVTHHQISITMMYLSYTFLTLHSHKMVGNSQNSQEIGAGGQEQWYGEQLPGSENGVLQVDSMVVSREYHVNIMGRMISALTW